MYNDKIFKLVEDLNNLGEDYLILDEFPLIYCTTGCESFIEVYNNIIFNGYDDLDYKDIINNAGELKYLFDKLYDLLNRYFSKMTNEEIEERYGLGVEEEE